MVIPFSTSPRWRCFIASVSLALLFAGTMTPAFGANDSLAQPRTLIVDRSLSKAQVNAQVIAAHRYDTIWSTGGEDLARAALAPGFTDHTLPLGRPQGIAGPLAASKMLHAAIPDIQCEIEQMIVAGDRAVAHLHFRGHFTGRFKDTHGQRQAIDFIATDICPLTVRESETI
jgi:predicted ester cyclase